MYKKITVDESDIFRIKLGIERINEQLLKLRKAIEERRYDPRSMVADCVLLMEAASGRIAEALTNIKEDNKRDESNDAPTKGET